MSAVNRSRELPTAKAYARVLPDKSAIVMKGVQLETCVTVLSDAYQDHTGPLPRAARSKLIQRFENSIIRPASQRRGIPSEIVLVEWLRWKDISSHLPQACLWNRVAPELYAAFADRRTLALDDADEEFVFQQFGSNLGFAVAHFTTASGEIRTLMRTDIRAQEGDVVCVIKGFCLPVLLRPGGKDGVFTFLGASELRSPRRDPEPDEELFSHRKLEDLELR